MLKKQKNESEALIIEIYQALNKNILTSNKQKSNFICKLRSCTIIVNLDLGLRGSTSSRSISKDNTLKNFKGELFKYIGRTHESPKPRIQSNYEFNSRRYINAKDNFCSVKKNTDTRLEGYSGITKLKKLISTGKDSNKNLRYSET